MLGASVISQKSLEFAVTVNSERGKGSNGTTDRPLTYTNTTTFTVSLPAIRVFLNKSAPLDSLYHYTDLIGTVYHFHDMSTTANS